MAAWALYGTTQDGFAKPDVLADGAHVVSLLAPGSILSAQHTSNIVGTNYFKMGGTSMAAPQVSGMAALMLQNNPSLTNRQIKRRLMSHTVAFGTLAYTSTLGLAGGFLDESAITAIDADSPNTASYSQSYNPVSNTVLAGGVWWLDGSWTGTAWDNTSWSNTSWSSSDFAAASWVTKCGATSCLPVLVSTVWSNTSWSNTSWSNTSWSNTSWSSVGWNNTSWSNTSWSNTSWSNTSWSNSTWS
jgi:serine protease AprX